MRSRLGGQRTCQLRLQQYHLGAFRRKGGIELGETPRICRTRLPGYIGAWQRTTLPETAAHALDKSLQGLESVFFLLASEKWGIGKMATPHPPIWVDNAFPHRWIWSSSYTLSSVYWLILCLNRGSSSFSKSFFVRYCYLTYVAEMSVKCAWKIGFSLWQMSKGIEWG